MKGRLPTRLKPVWTENWEAVGEGRPGRNQWAASLWMDRAYLTLHRDWGLDKLCCPIKPPSEWGVEKHSYWFKM